MQALMNIHPVVLTVAMLTCANVFMTLAWYGHLRYADNKTWLVAALISWLIAFFEYLIQVPANRMGHAAGLSVGELKIIQEVVTLAVFVPFSVFFLQEPLKLDYLWAALCLMGAVYFVFRQST